MRNTRRIRGANFRKSLKGSANAICRTRTRKMQGGRKYVARKYATRKYATRKHNR